MPPAALGANRRNVFTVASVVALFAVTHLLLPLWSGLDARTIAAAQYGTYLTVFTIWMAWFVATGVELIDD